MSPEGLENLENGKVLYETMEPSSGVRVVDL
jgi:hypothetical protein